MDAIQNVESSASLSRFWSFDRLFDAANKTTVIQLRWPLVILSSFLLLYSPSEWLTANQTHAVLIFYLLTNATLYFLADDLFDSPYFYGPLLFFDTVCLAAVLGLSGEASSDFYIACFFTLVLSCICSDSRGLLVVTLLAPLLYAYVVFNSAVSHDPRVYLRLPFPFVIALFYGYFAQVERIRRVAREKEEQATKQQRAAEEIRRQRERLEVLREFNLAVTSTIDLRRILEVFLERALIHLPYAAAIVRLRNVETGMFETAAAQGIATPGLDASNQALAFIDGIVEAQAPLVMRNVFADPRVENLEFFRGEGLVSILGVPLVMNGEALGSLAFMTREEHDFVAEEKEFLVTLAGQAAVAIRHSQLFEQSRRQANELRHAHKVKSEFLGAVSQELRAPLQVICGYTDMFSAGLLGAITPIQEKALHTVARLSKELHGLINTVLQVSAMEAETVQVELREVDLWDFLSELRSCYDYPLAKDVKLVWQLPADLPTVYADRLKIKHILDNIITNAIKFTDRGTITVSASYLATRRTIEFKIADSGVGIAKDQWRAIFERFHQVHSPENRVYGGVGLGLYIVKKYMDLFGGTILVESKVGRGSTFTLRIPAAPYQPVSTHPRLSSPTEIEISPAQGV